MIWSFYALLLPLYIYHGAYAYVLGALASIPVAAFLYKKLICPESSYSKIIYGFVLRLTLLIPVIMVVFFLFPHPVIPPKIVRNLQDNKSFSLRIERKLQEVTPEELLLELKKQGFKFRYNRETNVYFAAYSWKDWGICDREYHVLWIMEENQVTITNAYATGPSCL